MKTSINFKPVKSDSEIHNFRRKIFSYIRKDLVKNNEYWSEEKISSRLQKIENYCKEKSGRKLQKNAIPIREAVVVIKENTTMMELQNLAEKLKIELGIEVFQIAIHKDEGHYDQDTGEWKANYHAHMVVDFQDKTTGKTLKHKSFHYSKMQDLAAECLRMERGIPGSKKRLEAIEFKLMKKEEDYRNLIRKIEIIATHFSSDQPLELIVKEQNDLGQDKINIEKTMEKFKIALKVFKSDNELSKQKLQAKNKKILDYENKILELFKVIRKYQKEQFQLISNPNFFEKKKSEIENSVLKLIENALKYEIQNRPRDNWKSTDFVMVELPKIFENLALKNGIPLNYFDAIFLRKDTRDRLLDIMKFITKKLKNPQFKMYFFFVAIFTMLISN